MKKEQLQTILADYQLMFKILIEKDIADAKAIVFDAKTLDNTPSDDLLNIFEGIMLSMFKRGELAKLLYKRNALNKPVEVKMQDSDFHHEPSVDQAGVDRAEHPPEHPLVPDEPQPVNTEPLAPELPSEVLRAAVAHTAIPGSAEPFPGLFNLDTLRETLVNHFPGLQVEVSRTMLGTIEQASSSILVKVKGSYTDAQITALVEFLSSSAQSGIPKGISVVVFPEPLPEQPKEPKEMLDNFVLQVTRFFPTIVIAVDIAPTSNVVRVYIDSSVSYEERNRLGKFVTSILPSTFRYQLWDFKGRYQIANG